MPKTGRKIYLVLGFRYASLENVVPIGVFSSHAGNTAVENTITESTNLLSISWMTM